MELEVDLFRLSTFMCFCLLAAFSSLRFHVLLLFVFVACLFSAPEAMAQAARRRGLAPADHGDVDLLSVGEF